MGRVVVDRSPEAGKYSNYAPGESADELVARYAEELERARGAIRTVVGALVPLRPERLELIATLDSYASAVSGTIACARRCQDRTRDILLI